MKKSNIFGKIAGMALAAVAIFAVGTGSASAGSREEFAKSWRKTHSK